jgi:hypothetical protein
MELQEIIDRVVEDEKFAEELASQAAAAAGGGVYSEAWRDYARHFADTPEELEQLIPPQGALGIKWTTITTLTTVTTAGCTMTTTTTTTTQVPKFCKASSDPKKIAFDVVRREKIYPLAGFPIRGHQSEG